MTADSLLYREDRGLDATARQCWPIQFGRQLGVVTTLRKMLGLVLAALLVLLGTVFVYYCYWESTEYVRTVDLIPGHRKIPIVGYLFPRQTDGIIVFLCKNSATIV